MTHMLRPPSFAILHIGGTASSPQRPTPKRYNFLSQRKLDTMNPGRNTAAGVNPNYGQQPKTKTKGKGFNPVKARGTQY